MNKIFLATTALLISASAVSAADLASRPYTKAAPMMEPSWNWSGFYIGGNVGYGISHSQTDKALVDPTRPSPVLLSSSGSASADGVIGGGQIGWNMMVAPTWLLGVEADIQGADQKGKTTTTPGFVAPGAFLAVESRLNWFGTVRARLGWTATPETLLYVTGGYAYGEVETRNSSGVPDVFAGGANILAGSTAKSVKDGWTVGGGIETRLWNSNWTAKAEYLYMDLGNQGSSNLVGLGAATHVSNVDFKDHIVRVGLNYKLGAY